MPAADALSLPAGPAAGPLPPSASFGLPRGELERQRVEEQLEKLRLQNRRMKAESVNRELVAVFMARLAAVLTGEMLSLPATLPPELSAAVRAADSDDAGSILLEGRLEAELYQAVGSASAAVKKYVRTLFDSPAGSAGPVDLAAALEDTASLLSAAAEQAREAVRKETAA